jgi:hypothetical protein
MSENTPEATAADPGTDLPDVPEDAPEGDAIGYAVYDLTLAQYVGGVVPDKPSRADAKAQVQEGHEFKVIRV